MRRYSQLSWLALATVMFLAGIFVPGRLSAPHLILVIGAVIVGLYFYIDTFREVLHGNKVSEDRRIFWIIAIICLPMIGNMLYVIIHHSTSGRQAPKQLV